MFYLFLQKTKSKYIESQDDDSLEQNYEFNCKTCAQGFRIEADLTIHLSIHSNDGQNKCIECKKQFSSKFHYFM